MGELSKLYGKDKAFEDDQFLAEFAKLSYPEVGEFLQNHVAKNQPIDYNFYLNKVGLAINKVKRPVKMAFTLGIIPTIPRMQNTQAINKNPRWQK